MVMRGECITEIDVLGKRDDILPPKRGGEGWKWTSEGTA